MASTSNTIEIVVMSQQLRPDFSSILFDLIFATVLRISLSKSWFRGVWIWLDTSRWLIYPLGGNTDSPGAFLISIIRSLEYCNLRSSSHLLKRYRCLQCWPGMFSLPIMSKKQARADASYIYIGREQLPTTHLLIFNSFLLLSLLPLPHCLIFVYLIHFIVTTQYPLRPCSYE